MKAPLLLDTCAVIWIANDQPVASEADETMQETLHAGELAFISPITAWEIGLLVSRGRVRLNMSPQLWFDRMLTAPGIALANMSPAVLIASSFLPGNPPRDPADRIIAATAREYGYRLMTRDRPLLAYGEEGHLQVVSC
jgi:PIN domain nuclease of toxin-antitoxin system